MGSFYSTCSVTRQTITDDQEMYMQFMLPSCDSNYGDVIDFSFKTFFEIVEKDGIDAAKKLFKDNMDNFNSRNELSSKGMFVSNSGALSKWVPFGPAIRGFYDDYGRIRPADDEDSQKRVEVLEKLMGGLPFSTIQGVAQDDRWFIYGLNRDDSSSNLSWILDGLSKDMPEWQLLLCKKLSMTYFHASVYDELKEFNFSSYEKNGIMKSKYDLKWKHERIDDITEKFLKSVISKYNDEDMFLRRIDREVRDTYIERVHSIYTSGDWFDWYQESHNFIINLSGLCMVLDQTQYGSQENNWYGWRRILKALEPKIDEKLKWYEEDGEDYEEEE
jgi:hypothetical protein